MLSDVSAAPTPDLRIVPIDSLRPHEEHDSQRSQPLVERLKNEALMINPPVVAPMSGDEYVILDGANRCHSFLELGYPHILVQVVSYEAGYVQLKTWSHVVSHWNSAVFLKYIQGIKEVHLSKNTSAEAIAHLALPDGALLAIETASATRHEQNAALRRVVALYQQNALLHRTAMREPEDIWQLYDQAIAILLFPNYQPSDIIAAAQLQAYLPPGVSRHIVHGRALRVNYSLDLLRDPHTSLETKNNRLKDWLQAKLQRRQLRYYAESTYQFDE